MLERRNRTGARAENDYERALKYAPLCVVSNQSSRSPTCSYISQRCYSSAGLGLTNAID